MTQVRYIKIGQNAVLSPDTFDEPGLANSIDVPRGAYPGSAWLIVSRELLNYLSQAFGTEQTIYWHDFAEGNQTGNPAAFMGYTFAKATAINQDGDSKAAYLVELQDRRALLWNSKAVIKRYNVQRPIPIYVADGVSDVNKYHTDSLSGATTLYTWAQVWSDLWGLLPSAIAGSVPALPYTPAGKPKHLVRWWNDGICAWQACCEFLSLIGCDIVYKPSDGSFTVVRLGTTQSDLATLKNYNSGRLLFDDKSRSDLLAIEPAQFEICFPKLTPSHNANGNAAHIITPSDSISGAKSNTRLQVWDTMPAVDFPVGTIANLAAELTARAAEIGTNSYNRLTISDRFAYQEYSGPRSEFTCGSQVSRLLFRDFGDEDGCRTELHQGPSPLLSVGPQRIQSAKSWIGKTSGSHSLDASQNVRYWMGATAQSDSGVDVSCYLRFGCAAVPTAKFVNVSWENDQWEIVAARTA